MDKTKAILSSAVYAEIVGARGASGVAHVYDETHYLAISQDGNVFIFGLKDKKVSLHRVPTKKFNPKTPLHVMLRLCAQNASLLKDTFVKDEDVKAEKKKEEEPPAPPAGEGK
jgi:hypothetical protein